MLSSGIPFDITKSFERSTSIIERYLHLENKEEKEHKWDDLL